MLTLHSEIRRFAQHGLKALETLEERFRAEGFLPGKPEHVSAETIAIDQDVLAEATCDDCAHVGLTLVPYHHKRSQEYRALACCPACLDSWEF